MLVQDFLQDSAARTPDKTALICEGRRLTYAEVDATTNQMAHALRAAGIKRGDRVGLYLPNSIELALGIFAVLKAGGTFVVIDPTTKYKRLHYIANDCRLSALFAPANNQQVIHQLKSETPSLGCVVLTGSTEDHRLAPDMFAFDSFRQDAPTSRPARINIDLDLAALVYTSGSTGDPKGVMSAHCNMVAAASSIIEYLQNTPDDIVMVVSPLSFDYGLYQLLMTFKFGGTLVIEKGFKFPAVALKRIEQERVTGFPGVPTVFSMLLNMELAPYDLSSLRYMTNTGDALSMERIRQVRQKFPWVRFYSMYGVSETKRTLYMPPEELEHRPGSVGIAIPNTEVWLEDEEGQRVGPGGTGELVVRGGHVMRGYWENEKATARAFRPGPLPGELLHYTGDLFRMDEAGYLYYLSRKDNIFNCRGEKVPPKEIENVLYELPGVIEAAVIGVPDEVQGHVPKAFLVVNGNNLTKAEVLRHCREHLQDFMVPREIEFRDELPTTTSGKILRTGLS